MIVLDANVWISSLLPADVNKVVSRNWLSRTLAAGDSLITPSIFLAEVTGAVARRTGDRTGGTALLQQIQANAAIQIVEVDLQLAQTAARLASTLALRGVPVSQGVRAITAPARKNKSMLIIGMIDTSWNMPLVR